MWKSGIVVTVLCGCSMSSVSIRDEQGCIRAVLDADGLALFDHQGSERVQVRVGADGEPSIVLRRGEGQVRLGATSDGWELTVGERGGESTVMLLAPDGGQPYLKLGQVAVGYERRPSRGDGGAGAIETNAREMGLTFLDDDGCKRVFVGMDRGQWGLSLRDDTGRRRAELWTADRSVSTVAYLCDQDGTRCLTLGAEREYGGWVRVEGANDQEFALVSRDKVGFRAAMGEVELATNGKGQPAVRVRSDDGAQVEVGITDGSAPYVELKDVKGEVLRVGK